MINMKGVVYGTVPSKSNCYQIVKIGSKSTLAKTKRLKAYEDTFFMQCLDIRNKNYAGYFEFHVKVFYPSNRSDLDNSLKILLDCLQKPVRAIKNDNKCVKIVAGKGIDKVKPRIEFEIKPIEM